MCVKFTAMSQFISAAEQWLSSNTVIPLARQRVLAEIVPALLVDYPTSSQRIISIAGPPGTGKSTLAGACCAALEDAGLTCLVISLDDYYLPKAQRLKLARSEHSLFEVRGVPGTHELDLLLVHLQALMDPDHGHIEMPQFDKSLDDRNEEPKMIKAGFVPAFIFIEGWIVGAPPQSGGDLLTCANQFEEENDPDGEWRNQVNANLYDYFTELNRFIQERWYLNAPGWDSVLEWRLLQAQSAHQGLLSNKHDVCRFLEHYHRLCMHMQAKCEQWADVIIDFDTTHVPVIRSFG
ncbi:MAG: D-glycerate 3-kinase [Lysobacterales bacterium]|jgi:D-glycerate 3-kinase